MAAGAPVAILVDDAHLLDAASCGVLGFAGRRVAGLRVGLVVAAHGSHPALDGLPERPIERLDARSARRLVETAAPACRCPGASGFSRTRRGCPWH